MSKGIDAPAGNEFIALTTYKKAILVHFSGSLLIFYYYFTVCLCLLLLLHLFFLAATNDNHPCYLPPPSPTSWLKTSDF